MRGSPTVEKIAYRLETARLVVHCWSPEDAVALKQAEDDSRQHLARSLRWAAKGPQTLDEVVAKLRAHRSKFDAREDFQ